MAITGSNVGLYLLRCSVGGASWPKAETRLREFGVEDRREDLQDGLLDQAVDHVWNSEISRAAIRLGNGLAPGRARLISPFQELPPNLRPMVPEGIGEFIQGDTIGPRPTSRSVPAPRFALTFLQAVSRLARSTILSIRFSVFLLKAGFSTAAETDSSVWSSDALWAQLSFIPGR